MFSGTRTVEFLVSKVVMDRSKVIRSILVNLASMAQDGCRTTRMPAQDTRRIIHLAIDHKPAVVRLIMLLNLLTCKLL